MDDIIFRKAYPDEGPLLTELSLRSKSFWQYTPEFLEKCRPHLEIDEAYILHWPVIVLSGTEQSRSKIIGYYSLKIIGSEKRLDNLWLDLPFIGKGYGRLAMEHSKEVARQLGWDHFYLASEPNAVPFYKKLGGTLVGRVQSKLDEKLKLPHMKFSL